MKKLIFLLFFLKLSHAKMIATALLLPIKIISNGEFLFVGVFDPNQNTTEDDLTAGLADVNLEVSQSTYNAYEIGDVYCYE